MAVLVLGMVKAEVEEQVKQGLMEPPQLEEKVVMGYLLLFRDLLYFMQEEVADQQEKQGLPVVQAEQVAVEQES